MASLESLREQYSRNYSAVIDMEAGTWTYTDGSLTLVFTTREKWVNYVDAQRAEALKGLLLLRDYTSEIQNLPGIKPYFRSDEDSGGLSPT